MTIRASSSSLMQHRDPTLSRTGPQGRVQDGVDSLSSGYSGISGTSVIALVTNHLVSTTNAAFGVVSDIEGSPLGPAVGLPFTLTTHLHMGECPVCLGF
jgi:hypothetical protein